MNSKKIIKNLIFCIIFVTIFNITSDILRSKQITKPWDFSRKTCGFYNEPQNTLDVISFGSSHSYASINPTKIWDEIGVPSYILATSNQPIWITYYYMKEALKYQKPKVIILDVHMIVDYDENYGTEAMNYTAFNEMKFSKNKIDAINDSVPINERIYYYLDIFKYHSRWKELSKDDFNLSYKKQKDSEKGMVILEGTKSIPEYNYPNTNKCKDLPSKTKLYLDKIIELTKKNNIQLLLIKAPNHPNKEYVEKLNTIANIAKENNIPFINYNTFYKKIGIEDKYDFYDPRHLNYKGANKLTEHLTNYLNKKYDLKNKKNNSEYIDWCKN